MFAVVRSHLLNPDGTLTCPVLVSLALVLAVVAEAKAGENLSAAMCPGPIFIRGDYQELGDLVCDAVVHAKRMLEPCGLRQTRPIEVELVGQMGKEHEACVAYFNCEADSLALLAPSAITASGEIAAAFRRLPIDEYFRSVIVHEMTHALVHQSHSDKFSRVAHEYLAYSMQIASLKQKDRSLVLDGLEPTELVDIANVDEIGLAFGPSQFALQSYQHFRRPEKGCTMIERIIAADPELPEGFLSD